MNALAEKFSNIIIKQSSANLLGEIILSLEWFYQISLESKAFKFAINSTMLKSEQKISIIKKCAKASKVSLDNISINIFMILIKLKKVGIISEIAENLKKLSLKAKGISKTDLVFASKPSDKQVKIAENILRKICKIDPEITIKIDPSVVAGFVAFFDGRRLDASLHNAFEDLAQLRIE